MNQAGSFQNISFAAASGPLAAMGAASNSASASACGKDCATCPRRLECPLSPDALKRMTGGGR